MFSLTLTLPPLQLGDLQLEAEGGCRGFIYNHRRKRADKSEQGFTHPSSTRCRRILLHPFPWQMSHAIDGQV